MGRESTQKKLSRVRPPRVHITYDVEVNGAIELKEIPFVVGVLSDLSGKPDEALPKLKDRKFIEIDRDNFNDVLAGMKPRLAYMVENTLTGEPDSKLPVELRFKSIDDFHPENVVKQVNPLKELMDVRARLSDFLARMDGNEKLLDLWETVIDNTEAREALSKEAEAANSAFTGGDDTAGNGAPEKDGEKDKEKSKKKKDK